MYASKRAVAVPLLLALVVGACTSSASSPSASTSATASTVATPTTGSTGSPTEAPTTTPEPTPTPTPVVTPHSTPTPAPTPAPTLVHGQYLLALTHPAGSNQTYRLEAVLVQPNGSNKRVLVSGQPTGLYQPYYDVWTIWAHNGSKVHLTVGCDSHLSDASPLGGSVVPTVTMTDKDQGFVWSPDDSKIAYWHHIAEDINCMQNTVDDSVDLMVMNANGSGKKMLVHDISLDGLLLQGWNHDGTAVVARFGAGWQYVNVSNGTTVGILGMPATATNVELSPDGTKIAYLYAGHAWARSLMGALPSDLGTATGFAWKPNSSAIALLGTSLRVVTLGNPTATSTIYAGTTTKASWSPDGAQIAFLKEYSYFGGKIFLVASTGGAATPVPGIADAMEVYWQP